MKISKIERLMLINQFTILEKLEPDEADYYSRHRKALESGYTLNYSWMFEYLSEEMSEEECTEVINILDMYSTLLFSFRDLKDKSGINEHDLRFRGFDGNNETEQLSYAHYFMYDLNRFNELHEKGAFADHNSHCPMLPTYRKMLKEWGQAKNKHKLSKEDILRIIVLE